jgi:hypothetical protein
VQQGDELGHPRHLNAGGTPQPDAAADHNGADEKNDTEQVGAYDYEGDGREQGEDHPRDAVDNAAAGGLMLGEPRKAQDEQQRSNNVSGARDGDRNGRK